MLTDEMVADFKAIFDRHPHRYYAVVGLDGQVMGDGPVGRVLSSVDMAGLQRNTEALLYALDDTAVSVLITGVGWRPMMIWRPPGNVSQQTVTERQRIVGAKDAQWFREHPSHDAYVRPYLYGEFPTHTEDIQGTMVSRLPGGKRRRQMVRCTVHTPPMDALMGRLVCWNMHGLVVPPSDQEDVFGGLVFDDRERDRAQAR